MRKSIVGIAAFGVLGLALADSAQPVKVRTDAGVLVGSTDKTVNIFKGVPYSKPPVGRLRWTAPGQPDAWKGERDATRFALPCPQPMNTNGTPNGGGMAGEYDEDCLYLNVWAPAGAKNAPVMLWLPGGAGFLGAGHVGSYDGSAFARDGIILVTINYRLGALGSFAHPALTRAASRGDPLSSYLLMDVLESLRWVQRNIAAFGGDRANVTLFGQSAGGGVIMGLLSTDRAKGLFHKVILQSANAYSMADRGEAMLHGSVSLAAAEEAGVKAATAVGLPGADATLEQLRGVPAKTFVDTEATRRGIGVGYVLDGRLRKMTTADAIKGGATIDVPVMVGRNDGEAGYDTALDMAKMSASGTPTYLYQFTYVPEWKKAAQPYGAPHSAEIVYVFDSWDTSMSGGSSVTPKDRAVAARMHSCWVSFAKASSSARSLRCADGFEWPAYTSENDAIAIFSDRPSLGKASAIAPFAPPPRPVPGAG